MKKRIIAACVCVVIVALSVLTAFSGCSGEDAKEVENRDEFFSEIAGRYGTRSSNIYFFEDGTFQINLDEIYYDSSSSMLVQLKGFFKTVYQESEFCYHTEISRLNESLCIKTSNNEEPEFDYQINDDMELFSYDWPYCGLNSNDIIYIFAPGTPVSELQTSTQYMVEYNDNDSDGKLDDFLFLNYTKSYSVTRFEERDYITDGIWIDYDSHSTEIDVYDFDYYDVKVSRYDLSTDKLEQTASSIDGINPLYYTTSDNNVIVFFDNGKASVISPTDNINKMKYYADATDSTTKIPHTLYHHNKLPEYDVLVKEAGAARTGNTNN